MSVVLQPLNPSDSREAERTLARAFVANPLHVAAFGAERLAANEAFFRIGLAAMRGPKFVAMEGARVLGLIHWVPAPGCRFSAGEKLRMMPRMISGLGFGPAQRVRKWLKAWDRIHPVEPHIHLGPIGVSPEARGRHIGHDLMELFCREADRSSAFAYLETDRAENTVFYERFGFETFHSSSALGVPCYYMKRMPRRERKKEWMEL